MKSKELLNEHVKKLVTEFIDEYCWTNFIDKDKFYKSRRSEYSNMRIAFYGWMWLNSHLSQREIADFFGKNKNTAFWCIHKFEEEFKNRHDNDPSDVMEVYFDICTVLDRKRNYF